MHTATVAALLGLIGSAAAQDCCGTPTAIQAAYLVDTCKALVCNEACSTESLEGCGAWGLGDNCQFAYTGCTEEPTAAPTSPPTVAPTAPPTAPPTEPACCGPTNAAQDEYLATSGKTISCDTACSIESLYGCGIWGLGVNCRLSGAPAADTPEETEAPADDSCCTGTPTEEQANYLTSTGKAIECDPSCAEGSGVGCNIWGMGESCRLCYLSSYHSEVGLNYCMGEMTPDEPTVTEAPASEDPPADDAACCGAGASAAQEEALALACKTLVCNPACATNSLEGCNAFGLGTTCQFSYASEDCDVEEDAPTPEPACCAEPNAEQAAYMAAQCKPLICNPACLTGSYKGCGWGGLGASCQLGDSNCDVEEDTVPATDAPTPPPTSPPTAAPTAPPTTPCCGEVSDEQFAWLASQCKTVSCNPACLTGSLKGCGWGGLGESCQLSEGDCSGPGGEDTVAPTEAVTDAPTDPATVAPTEAVTDAPTEAATAAPDSSCCGELSAEQTAFLERTCKTVSCNPDCPTMSMDGCGWGGLGESCQLSSSTC